MVATRMAIDAGARVSSLVIASAPASGLAFERAGLVRALRFARCLTHPPRQAERCIVTRVLSHEFRAEHPREAERIEELAARAPTSRITIVAHALAGVRHDASAELGAIHAPTLLLVGDRDRLLGPDAGLALERGIRGARRLVLAGAGHDLTLERPRETATRVLGFVSSFAREALRLHRE
jgi:pimeloyl-ACP methyl ester carboxylesterase